MFTNYLKIAVRNILRHKSFSFINIAGLAVGMACCLLIFFYVQSELSYNRFHEKVDRIYGLVNDVRFPTGVTKTAYTSAFPGPTMAEVFPEIESMARLARARESFVFSHQAQLLAAHYFHRLFGTASFAAERRTKEIGIRKVLGATVANVIGLLSKDFVKLVLIANLLAWPVAWYAMRNWLQNFAYRVDIGWWVFVLAGGLAFVIALLTVSAQAIRAVLANPVEALRYE